jgi:hypothetical protein
MPCGAPGKSEANYGADKEGFMARKRISKPAIQRWGDWERREVTGQIADIRANEMGKLLDIRTADGILTFGFTKVLESLLADVPKGTRVWIICTGKQRNKAGKDFFAFDVDIDVPEEASKPSTPVVEGVAAGEADSDIHF